MVISFIPTQSTLKANANKGKWVKVQVEQSRRDYLDELDRTIDEDRLAHVKKPLKVKAESPKTREITQSTTDADSDYLVSPKASSTWIIVPSMSDIS
ncbi:MAG: hypothetical protein JKX81_13050 [Arenicella sp.]|nr:hypothetical protein [Arenicella sp.]